MVRAVGPEPGEDEVLRAKYLDWCSARVAERFLRLTPEEIYELAQRAAHVDEDPRSVARAVALSSRDDEEGAPQFRRIIERLTASLTAELDLPSFELWSSDYAADPRQYDEELLGLWRERMD